MNTRKMAINISSGEVNPISETRDTQVQEIYYNGYFYDVTDFISRHPGGNVIKFYTERGEDATQAIQQFHFRSRNRVDAILKTFKKRPAEPQDRGLEPKAFSRHEALTVDFRKLFEELQTEGYFEFDQLLVRLSISVHDNFLSTPSIPHVILRLLECAATTFLAYGIFSQCGTFMSRFFGAILVGFSLSRWGWVQHEGGHCSLTGLPKIDKFIQTIGNSFVVGTSCVWWNSQHNRHHAMPQRVNRDVDLKTLPYVAFHPKTVKNSKEINRFFVRYQAVLYWTLDLLIVAFAWRVFLHPRYQLHKRAYVEMLFCLPSWILAFYVGPFWYFAFSYWLAFFLGINFALSHTHLDVTEEPTHWVEYALTHSANITPSMAVDYWMGYLNYQIEHHLFPTMPQFRQRKICHRVRALAEKHGLPYRVYNYPEACVLAIKNLDTVGKELTRKEHFSET